jgi:hypothetical protein
MSLWGIEIKLDLAEGEANEDQECGDEYLNDEAFPVSPRSVEALHK